MIYIHHGQAHLDILIMTGQNTQLMHSMATQMVVQTIIDTFMMQLNDKCQLIPEKEYS